MTEVTHAPGADLQTTVSNSIYDKLWVQLSFSLGADDDERDKRADIIIGFLAEEYDLEFDSYGFSFYHPEQNQGEVVFSDATAPDEEDDAAFNALEDQYKYVDAVFTGDMSRFETVEDLQNLRVAIAGFAGDPNVQVDLWKKDPRSLSAVSFVWNP